MVEFDTLAEKILAPVGVPEIYTIMLDFVSSSLSAIKNTSK